MSYLKARATFVLIALFLFTWAAAAQNASGGKAAQGANGPVKPAALQSLGRQVEGGFRAVGNIASHPEDNLDNWTTPSLKGSRLKIEDAIQLEEDQNEEFRQELVRVRWRPGDGIDLYITKPEGTPKPPVILYLYSFPSENDRYRDENFCRRLTQNGFAAVGFVAALDGQRYHDRPMREWFVSELPEALADTAHDVQMILNYLTTRGDLDMRRVGMFGEGSGASIAILAAAVDPRIKALDLVNPWGDWPDWMARSARIPEQERPNFLTAEFLAKAAPLDPVRWLPGLRTPNVRIRDAKESLTPLAAQGKLEAAAPPQALIFRYEHQAELARTFAGGKAGEWIAQQLQLGSPGEERAGGESALSSAKAVSAGRSANSESHSSELQHSEAQHSEAQDSETRDSEPQEKR